MVSPAGGSPEASLSKGVPESIRMLTELHLPGYRMIKQAEPFSVVRSRTQRTGIQGDVDMNG